MGNGEFVLVVDDELPVREMTRAVLQLLNFKVATASGRIDEASSKELETLGIKTVLNKPFTQEKLVIAIKKALRDAELKRVNK